MLQKHFEGTAVAGVSPAEVAATARVARFKKAWTKMKMKLRLAVHPPLSLEPADASLKKGSAFHGRKKKLDGAWRSGTCLTRFRSPLRWSVRGQGAPSLISWFDCGGHMFLPGSVRASLALSTNVGV